MRVLKASGLASNERERIQMRKNLITELILFFPWNLIFQK